MTFSELLIQAEAWADQDPDPKTRAELLDMIETLDASALQSRFGSRLAFGTAGLRGELGAGPNRMNRVLVGQAALGLARHLLENASDNKAPRVVIGFDGRVNSEIFARDSAEIMAGAGIKVLLSDVMCPTPLVAFAVKHLDLAAGVMVTASHNPKDDNGYKVYLGGANGGGQIVSPTDSQIAQHIEEVARTTTFDAMPKSSEIQVLGKSIREAYREQTLKLVKPASGELKIVYTAMHGVGWATVAGLFEAAGLPKPLVVAKQIEPDGSFPTVAFPNPEEPGALDLAFALAQQENADLVLANDPDADRLAIGIPTATGWARLTGDQLGMVLAHWAATRAKAEGIQGNLACSIVSSSALADVARVNGLGFVETLTGFKWITKVPNLIFGFEEALGYSVDPAHTPDKDGISAALVVASVASELAAVNKTIHQHIVELAEIYGHYATGQISIRVTDLSIIGETMRRLRSQPPAQIAGVDAKLTDLALGSDLLPPTDGLRFDLADGRRVIVRPSGTEPKLKCYLQAKEISDERATQALQQLDAAMRQLLR
jgi:phosphomannomutase